MGDRDNPHVFCTFDVVEGKRKAGQATLPHPVILWDVCEPLRICRYTVQSGLDSSEKIEGEIVPAVFFIKTLRRAEFLFGFRMQRKPLHLECFAFISSTT